MNGDPFWNGKRVFITGINGFVGGNLAAHISGEGGIVTGLIRNLHQDSFLYAEGLDEKVTLVKGEITDKELLSRILVESGIQVVFHLAAQVEVGVARQYPYSTWETNVRGTYVLMEALREHRKELQAVVVASSDKAYGEYGKERMPYKEEYPLIPVYPYDVSKACADLIARSYSSPLYNLPVVITRFSNIYGPGQLNFSAICPDAIRCALGYGEFVPRSDGTQLRDYLYIKDVVALYGIIARTLAGDPSLAGEIYNAGTNEPRSAREVIREIFTLLDKPEKLAIIEAMFEGKRAPGEISCQYMDYEKVNRHFGWTPRTSFQDGLRETIEWFRHYLARKQSR